MKKYLLPKTGNFYKANMHCHTTLSDGKKTPEEVKALYKRLGYSIVAYTDHDVFLQHNDLTDDTFLALNGYEMEINEPRAWKENPKTCHICFVALDRSNKIQPMWHRTKYLFGNAVNQRDKVKFDSEKPDYERVYSVEGITEIMQTGRDSGFFVTYNHPTWSLEDYTNYSGYRGMHAMEMFNGSCIVGGYEDFNPRVYDDILKTGNRIFCVGGDDNHNNHPDYSRRSDSGRAFTVIKAKNLKYRAVTKALENGDFYASEGPEIHELYVEDGFVYIKCSGADKIACNYDVRCAHSAYAENDVPLTEAKFKIREDAKYFRLTVTDARGRHACTNAYFLDSLKEE